MKDCWKRLPIDVIKQILSYDENIVIRKCGVIVYIGRIPRTDPRYQLLMKKPLIEENRVYLPISDTLSCLLIVVYPEMIETDNNNLDFTNNFLVDILKIQKFPHNYYQKVLYTITLPIN